MEFLFGLIISVLLYIFYPALSVGFLMGFGVVFLVDVFFTLRVRLGAVYAPNQYLKILMRAEMQKIVLYGLLIAVCLMYDRPDLAAFVCGLVAAIVSGRVFNLMDTSRKVV